MGEWYKLTYGDGETDVIRIKEGHDRHEREGDTWEPAVVFTVEELDAREKNWSDSVAVLTKMCLEYIERIAELTAPPLQATDPDAQGTTGNEAAMMWDNYHIEEEMEKHWKAHAETYQYLWVRELCRQIRDECLAALAAEHAAALERIAELEQENKGLYALLADRARAYSELKAQPAERSEFARSPVAGSLEWGTIEVALKNERSALCGCDACKLGRDSIDAALAFVREQRVPTAPQVAPTPQGQPQPDGLREAIRTVIYALEAWWTYGADAGMPSQTEVRAVEVVRRWLDAQGKDAP